jgi:hypothetical protein
MNDYLLRRKINELHRLKSMSEAARYAIALSDAQARQEQAVRIMRQSPMVVDDTFVFPSQPTAMQ